MKLADNTLLHTYNKLTREKRERRCTRDVREERFVIDVNQTIKKKKEKDFVPFVENNESNKKCPHACFPSCTRATRIKN